MQTRQNPITRALSRIEAILQRIIEGPFDRSTKIEPAVIARKLELAMEDGKRVQSGGRPLVPNVYDINVSIKDHKELIQAQFTYIGDWKQSLIEFARRQQFDLRTDPVLRLHGDSQMQPGRVRVEAHIEDPKKAPPGGGGGQPGDIMGTTQLTPEQLAQLKANLAMPQPVAAPAAPAYANPLGPMPIPPTPAPSTPVPEAWLTIRVPQGGQEKYLIKKPVVNIGRQRYNDIVVEDKRVSRDHAKILFQNGQFMIYDLGSTNGITINGTPRMRQHMLSNGDRFIIGSYEFYFQRL